MAGVRCGRLDGETVAVVAGRHPEPTELGDHGGDAVGLLGPDEADLSHTHRTRGQRGDGTEGGGGVGAVAQRDIDTGEPRGPAYLDAVGAAIDGRAHGFEDVDEGGVALDRVGSEAGHADTAAADGSGGEEVRRRRCVGFDRHITGPVAAGFDDVVAVPGDRHGGPEASHHGDGHGEIGRRDDRAGEFDLEGRRQRRCAQQQSRHELARRRGRDAQGSSV